MQNNIEALQLLSNKIIIAELKSENFTNAVSTAMRSILLPSFHIPLFILCQVRTSWYLLRVLQYRSLSCAFLHQQTPQLSFIY